ncbi:MAG: hypothetical protein ACKVU1_16695 [bacterium]
MISFHITSGTIASGGLAEHRIREELLALRDAGHPSLVFGAPGLAEFGGADAGPARGRGPLAVFSGASLADRVMSAASKARPSVIHAHGWDAIRTGHAVAKDIGAPLVVEVIEPFARGRHDANVLSLADRIVTPAASVAAQLATLGGDTRRIVHLRGSLDHDDLAPAPGETIMLPADRDFLLVFAPLAEGNLDACLAGLDTAIASNARLHLLIMGHPIGKDALKAVSARGLVPRVTFGGHPPVAFLAEQMDRARGAFFAVPDPGAIEPYALLALASRTRLVAVESEYARALFADAAHYVGATDAIGLGAALLYAMKSPKRVGGIAGEDSGRAALGERLSAIYAEIARV